VHKLKLSFKLLYKLIVVGILCFLSSTEEIAAAESQIEIIGSKNKAGQLAVSFEVHDFLTGKAIEFLNKGFTLKINYTTELWKSHSFWFDELVAQRKIESVITYDIVRREYSVFRKEGEEISEKTFFKMEQIVDWATKLMDVEIFQIDKLQKKAFYYYSINAELRMLTADDIKDLQRWFSDLESKKASESGSHSLSNIFLNVIAEFLVSRRVVRLKTESKKFRITADGNELRP
jgi:hypothetical protein